MNNLETIKNKIRNAHSDEMLETEIDEIKITLNGDHFDFDHILDRPYVTINQFKNFDLTLDLKIPALSNDAFRVLFSNKFNLVVEDDLIKKLKHLSAEELEVIERKVDALLRVSR